MSFLRRKSKPFNCEIHCKIISLLIALHIIIALFVITHNIVNRVQDQKNEKPTTEITNKHNKPH